MTSTPPEKQFGSAYEARIKELEAEVKQLGSALKKCAPMINRIAAHERTIESLREELMHWRGVAFAIDALRALNHVGDKRRWVITSGPGDNPFVEKMYISKPLHGSVEEIEREIDNV